MLHILNGAATEKTLRQSKVPGEFFSFRDVLIDGPTLRDLSEEEWCRARTEYLSQSYGIDYDECQHDFLQQSETLKSFSEHEEVVLWFEQDLFCQLNLLYLLDWFSKAEPGNTKLSLINIGKFPGRENFRGLGELNADELASLFPQRHRVSPAELHLSREAWAAFCSPDPTSIESLLQKDTSAMPFLATAFAAHLRRFPATQNGLGEIENKSLELIGKGDEQFATLFPKVVEAESVYGLGDAQVWLALLRLVDAKVPPLLIQNSQRSLNPSNDIAPGTSFKLTDTGKALLNSRVDFIKLNEIDDWLGGVHLQGGNQVWRWDEDAGRLRYC